MISYLITEKKTTAIMEWIHSMKVSVFDFRPGYTSKKFLFYLEILPFYENFEWSFSDGHDLTHLLETIIIF